MRARHASGKERTYSISELAQEFDITPRTIRYYEDEGLITPTREGQTRIYSHKDRIRLKLTLRGKRLGFSLAEIRELFDMYDTDRSSRMQLHSMIQLIEARRHSLRQQLEDIQMVMAELDAAEQRCIHSLGGLKPTGIDRLWGYLAPGIPVFQWIFAVAGPDPATPLFPTSPVTACRTDWAVWASGEVGQTGEIRPWSHNNSPARSECGAPHESFP